MTLAIREPTSLVEVDGQCAFIEAWAEQCDSIPELRDAANKLAAIDEYVARTSTSGRARVAAAMRRLEVRIGTLLGPAMTREEAGAARGCNRGNDLNNRQQVEFRQMAEHPEVVEEVIAASTDEKPASRRSVMERLRDAKAKHPAEPASFKSQAAVHARVATAKEMAAAGHTSDQIAAAIGITAGSMVEFRSRHGVDVPADAVVGKRARIDSNRIVQETVIALEGVVMGLDLVRFDDLDPTEAKSWSDSLTQSLRTLGRFAKNLKEVM